MRLLQWLRSWMRGEPMPTDVFVVCEGGEPIRVCRTEADVSTVLPQPPKRTTRVFRVPLS